MINDFITIPFDFQNEDILSTFISFLKTIALKAEFLPIDFFYNQVCKIFLDKKKKKKFQFILRNFSYFY